MQKSRILLLVLLLSFKVTAKQDSCRYELFPPIVAPESPGPGLIAIEADKVKGIKDKVITFSGNVKANLDGKLVETQQISYYPEIKHSNITGTTNYQGNGINFSSEAISVDSRYKIVNASSSSYLIPANKANGKADAIYRVSDVYTRLSKSTYSTCPVGQKIKDWHLEFSKIMLDHSEGWGKIKKAKLKIKNKPIFYLPSFTFPLDERRKSGFLIPYINYKSESAVALYTPWYWNIAPDIDAILTPGIVGKRGFWLGTELRYLNRKFISKLNLEGLSQDDLLDDKDRYFIGLDLKNYPGSNLTYGINYSKLSDDEYIDDFKKTNFDDDTNYVNQYAFINYQGNTWSLGAEAQAYQSLVDNRERYRLLPRVNFSWSPVIKDYINFGINHQFSKFEHKNITEVVGDRFNTEANFGFNIRRNAFFIKPGTKVQHTSYSNLENFTATSANRTATSYFIDTGVFFEREFSNNKWLQTLEPRLFYVKRAKEDENQLPEFDTSLISFSYNNLFSTNLYNGKDRSGELDRISLGLVSEFIRLKNNITHFEFRLGQGYNFDTRHNTNFAFETYINNNAWRGSIRNYFYPDDFKLETQETSVHYEPNKRLHLKTAYKFKDNVRKELDLAGAWQVNSRWLVYARSRYSFLSDAKRSIDELIGFEYDSCCWAINMNFRRQLTDSGSNEYDNSINLSLELKGLTGKRDTKTTIENIFE